MVSLFTTFSWSLILLLVPSFSGTAQEKKKDPMASSASVDFMPLDQLKGKRMFRMRLVLEGTDGKSFTLTLPFNNQAGIAGVAGCAFEVYWQDAKWNVTRADDRLTFHSYTDDKNRTIPIKSIQVTSEGTLPAAFLPIVTASKGVKLQREGDVPGKGKTTKKSPEKK